MSRIRHFELRTGRTAMACKLPIRMTPSTDILEVNFSNGRSRFINRFSGDDILLANSKVYFTFSPVKLERLLDDLSLEKVREIDDFEPVYNKNNNHDIKGTT